MDAEDSFCDILDAQAEEMFEIYDACRSEEEEYKEYLAFKSGASFAIKFFLEAIKGK